VLDETLRAPMAYTVAGDIVCPQCTASEFHMPGLHEVDLAAETDLQSRHRIAEYVSATGVDWESLRPHGRTSNGRFWPVPVNRYGHPYGDTPHCTVCGRCVDHTDAHCERG
jgi:hypothetical protein